MLQAALRLPNIPDSTTKAALLGAIGHLMHHNFGRDVAMLQEALQYIERYISVSLSSIVKLPFMAIAPVQCHCKILAVDARSGN
jgi:hypothetical protein